MDITFWNISFSGSLFYFGGVVFFWMCLSQTELTNGRACMSLRYLFMNSPPKAHPYHIPILKVEEQNFWQDASEWIWCWCRFWHVHRGWMGIVWGNPQHVMRHFRGLWFYISMSIDKRRWDLTMAGAWLKMAGSVNYTEPLKWSPLESDSETKTQ